MAITYHAGRRLQTTSTDFGTDGAGIPAVSGGWKELARTTLGSASNTITVSSLADKRYYMVLFDQVSRSGAANNDVIQFNTDTANNYSRRISANGGNDSTSINRLGIELYGNSTNNAFYTGYIANLAEKEKLAQIQLNSGGSTGAGNAPARVEIVGKWTNTSDAISEIRWKPNNSTETFGANSEMVVLGFDPADTHTTNFWEELASVNASGSSTNLSSGTITAKKYLWIQCYSEGTSGDILTTFNNDTGANYNRRFSIDGGSDSTSVNETSMANMHNAGLGGDDAFSNWFIINNSANEKLVIGHSVQNGSAGAGTAPPRVEFVHKWANTSSQITEIDFDSQSGNFGSDSIIKVWGSD